MEKGYWDIISGVGLSLLYSLEQLVGRDFDLLADILFSSHIHVLHTISYCIRALIFTYIVYWTSSREHLFDLSFLVVSLKIADALSMYMTTSEGTA